MEKLKEFASKYKAILIVSGVVLVGVAIYKRMKKR